MNTPTYQQYLEDPAIRVQIEREVRKARSEAFRVYLVAPMMSLFRRPEYKRATLQVRVA